MSRMHERGLQKREFEGIWSTRRSFDVVPARPDVHVGGGDVFRFIELDGTLPTGRTLLALVTWTEFHSSLQGHLLVALKLLTRLTEDDS